MSEKEKQYLPQSGAGLMRYGEGSEKLKMKPMVVIVMSLVFAGAVLVLKLFA